MGKTYAVRVIVRVLMVTFKGGVPRKKREALCPLETKSLGDLLENQKKFHQKVPKKSPKSP
jgi:hypothetical protein